MMEVRLTSSNRFFRAVLKTIQWFFSVTTQIILAYFKLVCLSLVCCRLLKTKYICTYKCNLTINLHLLAKNISAHLIKCQSFTKKPLGPYSRERIVQTVLWSGSIDVQLWSGSKKHRSCIRCKFRNSSYIKGETELICGHQKVSFCPVGEMGSCWRYCYTTCTCCLSEEERNAIVIHNEIKRILADQKKRERREIKVLLLGEIFFPINIYFKAQLWSKELRSL